jgi:hypothetical protein
MQILTEIINQIRDQARAAGCEGVVINAEIKLTICDAPVIIVLPIDVAMIPNEKS